MFQRQISENDILIVLAEGQTIEEYIDDTPYPSRLILGWCKSRPLHIVVADNIVEKEVIIITAYDPDPNQWEPDFIRRKS